MEREYLVLAQLPTLSLQILEIVRAHGRVTLSELVTLTECNRSTVKHHLQTSSEVTTLSLSARAEDLGTK